MTYTKKEIENLSIEEVFPEDNASKNQKQYFIDICLNKNTNIDLWMTVKDNKISIIKSKVLLNDHN